MSYELTKQLNDAGFPGSEDWREHQTDTGPIFLDLDRNSVPTLSELVEACGVGFGDLKAHQGSRPGEWTAHSALLPNCEAYGSTPEEAIAKLWLALNNK